MKIRKGFVSNSSSSSFFVRFDERYPNTLAIAESMIKDRFREWSEYKTDEKYNHLKLQISKSIEKLKTNGDVNLPIFFPSTNYDTYIKSISPDLAYVETCNNIRWNVVHNCKTCQPSEIIALYNKNQWGDNDFDIRYNTEYYIIEKGIIAMSTSERDTCKKCYDPYWYIGEDKYCIHCDWDKISRGLKINKIKNLIENSK